MNKIIDFFHNMSDEQAKIYIKQFTFLSEDQIKGLIELNNPPKLRILQRILVELVWFLNYGSLESFKKMLKTREEKILSNQQRKKQRIF